MEKAILPAEVVDASQQWCCDDPIPNGKNGRSSLLWSDSRRVCRPKVQLASPTENYYTIRKTNEAPDSGWGILEVSPGGDQQTNVLHQLDAYAMGISENKCMDWFGKMLTAQNIQNMYRPLIKDNGTLRLRYSPASCNIWVILNGNQRYINGTQNDLFAGCTILPCITVNGIYFKMREMGLSVTCSDILVRPPVCLPFHLDRPMTFGVDENVVLPEHEEGSDNPSVGNIAMCAMSDITITTLN